jgi:hypothetical protein
MMQRRPERSKRSERTEPTTSGIRPIRIFAIALFAGLLLVGPAHAENAFAKRSSQAFDLIVVRPLGVGRILAGVLAFIPAAIFAQTPSSDNLQSSVSDVWQYFVYDQVEATFMTPLGVFEEEY